MHKEPTQPQNRSPIVHRWLRQGPSLILLIPDFSPLILFGYQAIDILSPEFDIHQRCVRALGKACGIYDLLPDSHKVKFILKTGEHALASGGFSDIWKATNKEGKEFAIKVLRMYQNSAVQVKKVR